MYYERPCSPTTPFEFPFYTPSTLRTLSSNSILQHKDTITPSASVIQMIVNPRVFGIKGDCRASVQIKDWSLMDAGANICLTGDLTILADAVNISPLPITVPLNGNKPTVDDCCTMKGYIPLTLSDGAIHWQLCYYSANVNETIISPQAILASSDIFASWTMTGYKTNKPGAIRFDSHDGFHGVSIPLVCHDGLYYCPTNVFMLGTIPTMMARDICSPPFVALRVMDQPPPAVQCHPPCTVPTTKARQRESEVWLLRLGSPGVSQLDVLPQNATGLPATFKYHPFWFINFKEQARVRKQAAQRSVVRTPDRRRQFYMDYGFMCASTSDYTRRDKTKDRVIQSYDGYSSCLLIVDETTCFVWVFLTNLKSPPIDILQEFLTQHGHEDGGCIRTDQGGKLARSATFQDTHKYQKLIYKIKLLLIVQISLSVVLFNFSQIL
jgi:hypothetical protein